MYVRACVRACVCVCMHRPTYKRARAHMRVCVRQCAASKRMQTRA